MIKPEQCKCIPLERGGLAMKKRTITVFVIAGLLSALLSGCKQAPARALRRREMPQAPGAARWRK